jgi:hypothetical protein
MRTVACSIGALSRLSTRPATAAPREPWAVRDEAQTMRNRRVKRKDARSGTLASTGTPAYQSAGRSEGVSPTHRQATELCWDYGPRPFSSSAQFWINTSSVSAEGATLRIMTNRLSSGATS